MTTLQGTYSHPGGLDFWQNRQAEMDNHYTRHKTNDRLIKEGQSEFMENITMDYSCRICCGDGSVHPLSFEVFWTWMQDHLDVVDYTDYTVRIFTDLTLATERFREQLTARAWKICFDLAHQLMEAIEFDSIDENTKDVSELSHILVNLMVITEAFTKDVDRLPELTQDAAQHYADNFKGKGVSLPSRRHRKVPQVIRRANTPLVSAVGTPASTVATLSTGPDPFAGLGSAFGESNVTGQSNTEDNEELSQDNGNGTSLLSGWGAFGRPTVTTSSATTTPTSLAEGFQPFGGIGTTVGSGSSSLFSAFGQPTGNSSSSSLFGNIGQGSDINTGAAGFGTSNNSSSTRFNYNSNTNIGSGFRFGSTQPFSTYPLFGTPSSTVAMTGTTQPTITTQGSTLPAATTSSSVNVASLFGQPANPGAPIRWQNVTQGITEASLLGGLGFGSTPATNLDLSGGPGRYRWNGFLRRYVKDPSGIDYAYDPNQFQGNLNTTQTQNLTSQPGSGWGIAQGGLTGTTGQQGTIPSSTTPTSTTPTTSRHVTFNFGGSGGGGGGGDSDDSDSDWNNRNRGSGSGGRRGGRYSRNDSNDIIGQLTNALLNINRGNPAARELALVKVERFSGKESEDPVEWLEKFNRAAEANNWPVNRRIAIAASHLTDAASQWYEATKSSIRYWTGAPAAFDTLFLAKFANAARVNNWYMKYKNCRQNGKPMDEYITEFNMLLGKLTKNTGQAMASAKVDFILGTDLNIMMLLQGLSPTDLLDAQDKARNIYEGQRMATQNKEVTEMQLKVQALESQVQQMHLVNQMAYSQPLPQLQQQLNAPPPNTWRNPQSDRSSGQPTGRNKGRFSRFRKEDSICYNCGEKGHFAKDCQAENVPGNKRWNRRQPDRAAGVGHIQHQFNQDKPKDKMVIPIMPGYNAARDMFNHHPEMTFADLMTERHYREQVKRQIRKYEDWDKEHEKEVKFWERYEWDFDEGLDGSSHLSPRKSPRPKSPVATTQSEKRSAAHIYLSIKANSFMAMVDSGAVISVIAEQLARKLGLKVEKDTTNMQIILANGTPAGVVGICRNVPIIIKGQKAPAEIIYVMKAEKEKLLLGGPWLEAHKADIKYSNNTLEFGTQGKRTSTSIYVTENPTPYYIAGKPQHKEGEFEVSVLGLSHLAELANQEIEEDSHLTPEMRKQKDAILKEYKDIITTGAQDIGNCPLIKHQIFLTQQTPIRNKYKPHSPRDRDFIIKEVEHLERIGAIEPSASNYGFNIVLVTKKDGTTRSTVNYGMLNDATVRDNNIVPNTEEIFQQFGGSRYFTTLDLSSAYWQIPMDSRDKHLTAFYTPLGLYQWKVMPFGLSNAPATFQKAMDKLLRPYIGKFCQPYLDDIIIHSRTWKDHVKHVRKVLDKLRLAKLKIKPSKCEWFKNKVTFLGHTISVDGIRPNEYNLNKVRNAKPPQNLTQLRSFIGLCQYYKKLIPNLSQVAEPLFQKLRGGRKGKNAIAPNRPPPFSWDQRDQKAFDKLKNILTKEPVIAHPNFNRRFKLYTDASDTGLGAILCQNDDEDKERVVAYASRTLSKTERNWVITEKECLAVVWAVTYFRTYLDTGKEFDVYTDHAVLQTMLHHKDPSPKRARWLEKLARYNFKIHYRPGLKMQHADYLSRQEPVQCIHCAYRQGLEQWENHLYTCTCVEDEIEDDRGNEPPTSAPKYVLVVVYDEYGIYMSIRYKTPMQHQLQVVCGKVELGENSLTAAARELYEETGLTPVAHSINYMFFDREFQCACFKYKLGRRECPEQTEPQKQGPWLGYSYQQFSELSKFNHTTPTLSKFYQQILRETSDHDRLSVHEMDTDDERRELEQEVATLRRRVAQLFEADESPDIEPYEWWNETVSESSSSSDDNEIQDNISDGTETASITMTDLECDDTQWTLETPAYTYTRGEVQNLFNNIVTEVRFNPVTGERSRTCQLCGREMIGQIMHTCTHGFSNRRPFDMNPDYLRVNPTGRWWKTPEEEQAHNWENTSDSSGDMEEDTPLNEDNCSDVGSCYSWKTDNPNAYNWEDQNDASQFAPTITIISPTNSTQSSRQVTPTPSELGWRIASPNTNEEDDDGWIPLEDYWHIFRGLNHGCKYCGEVYHHSHVINANTKRNIAIGTDADAFMNAHPEQKYYLRQ